MRLRITLVVIVAAALAATGCTNIKSTFTPDPPVVTQEATAAASGVAVKGQIPDGFPDDLPLWPGAKVQDARPTDTSLSLVLKTTDTFDDVVPGIAAGFERSGWKAVAVSEEDSATVIEVSNNDYDGLVTVYREANGATVEYLLTPTN